MLSDVWTKTLWDQRRALAGWAIGLVAVALVYTGFYPLAATPAYADLVETLPPALTEAMGWDDIASPEGYLGSTVFGLLGPVLMIILATATGARSIAGDEESGYLELVIAHPVSRSRLVLNRALALLLALLGAGLVMLGAILAIREPIDLDVSVVGLASASLNLVLLAAVFGYLAMAVGSYRGRRSLVLGVTAMAAVFAYVADGLAPQVKGIEWLENLSPFHWFAGTDTLRDGLDPAMTLLLTAVCAAFVVLSVVAFNRRDLTV